MMPERVQLRRTKGWRMPPNTVKVDRSTKWGNPWFVTHEISAVQAVTWFRNEHVGSLPVAELRGKNLACWCPLDKPCHADVLLELANEQ
jgi:hypothetical protein